MRARCFLLGRLAMLGLALAAGLCPILTRHHLNTRLAILASRLRVVPAVILGHYFLDLGVEESLPDASFLGPCTFAILLIFAVVLLQEAGRVFDVVEGQVLVGTGLQGRSKTIHS